MKINIKKSLIAVGMGLLLASGSSATYATLATSEPVSLQNMAESDLSALVQDIYEYAYPLVLMDVTMQQAVNVPSDSAEPQRAPFNQFAHFVAYPDVNDREVVRFNFDTLFSMTWLNVEKEPVIISVPEIENRYFLLPMMDMWTDVFAAPGTRTTGPQGGNFAVAAPGWKGSLPEGVQLITAPTAKIWIIGRIQTNGPSDYKNVHEIQKKLKITPLSQWGKAYTLPANLPVDPLVDMKTPPLAQVENMTGAEFFTRFSELLAENPPHASDYPIIARMAKVGLIPGKKFDASQFDKKTLETMNGAAKQALAGMKKIILEGKTFGKSVNGWNYATEGMGAYGVAYQKRAVVALGGLGANLSEDAVYPNAFADDQGNPFSGENNYVLHFTKEELPPANAFWSVTLYDHEGFQIKNELNRFAIGDRDNMTFNPDGSLDIYIQKNRPAEDKVSNWLPAPQGGFQLTMRIYSPKRSVFDGSWIPPVVKIVKN